MQLLRFENGMTNEFDTCTKVGFSSGGLYLAEE